VLAVDGNLYSAMVSPTCQVSTSVVMVGRDARVIFLWQVMTWAAAVTGAAVASGFTF
jgi:hypothetical protein